MSSVLVPHISEIKQNIYDIIIIGGGIIGISVAKSLKSTLQNLKIALIEKEHDIALHQTSHNSSVIHAGIYYKPNSLKAKLCVQGLRLLYDYCSEKNIPVGQNGKLIVAQSKLETIRLRHLYERGVKNGVGGLEILDKYSIQQIQPTCNCIAALWSPHTGNIDWKTVAKFLAQDFTDAGGEILLNCDVSEIQESHLPSNPVKVKSDKSELHAKFVVLAMGLRSGSVLPDNNNQKQVSFRVNYGLLRKELRHFIKTNIYAMPHIDMPFLGVHFSPTVDGKVLLGPSAVPAFHVEGYSEEDFDADYMKDIMSYQGVHLLTLKYLPTCLAQFTQFFSNSTQAKNLQKYIPFLSDVDIQAGPQAVQAQLITENGEFIEDFIIKMFEGSGLSKRIVDCRFVPSPGATSALAIADMISKEVAKQFQ